MRANAQRNQSVVGLLDRTIAGRPFVKALTECVDAAAQKVLGEKALLDHKTDFKASALRTVIKEYLESRGEALGLERDIELNQCRLKTIRHERGQDPLRFRWCLGRVMYGTGQARFNSEKGILTQQGVDQNAEHFHRTMLFPGFEAPPITTPREANLWLLYQLNVEYSHMQAWLVIPDNLVGRTMAMLDSMLLLDKYYSDDIVVTPTSPSKPSNNEDYDIPFSVKSA